MPFRAYCRIPDKPKNSAIRAREGSCPQLLYDFIEELSGAKEVHIATYLFNNEILADALIELTKQGCKVFVTTLPPKGYSEKKVRVEGFEEKISGRELAKACFKKVGRVKNFDLRFFPHQYMWYGALYAGGGASYSFHLKSAMAKFPGRSKCFLGSGNFMVTDPCHSDNFLVAENERGFTSTYKRFFSDLETYSIPKKTFASDYPSMKEEFLYSFLGNKITLKPKSPPQCFFSSPFYFYNERGSNHYAGDRIIELINKAQRRVWVCAQHFHDLVSFDPGRETIIDAIYRRSLKKKNIDFRFLKQVPHSSLADKRRAAIAETLFQYVMKGEQRYNRLVHDKFIIVDNKLLISSGNFTPSQFAFGERVMDYKERVGNRNHVTKKRDNFSEVNGYAVLEGEKALLRQYTDHFNLLWDQGLGIDVRL